MKKYILVILMWCLALCAIAQPKADTTKVEETSAPDTVHVGAYIMSLHDINFHDKEYTARFWLWTRAKNPDFDFEKQVEIPNAKSMDKPEMLGDTLEDKSIWSLMKMKSVMKQDWNVSDFPFDEQHLYIKVENTIYDSKSLIFVADSQGTTFDPEMNVDGWKISEFKATTGISNYNTAFGDPSYKDQKSQYSNFSINMTLVRDAWGLFFKLFLGMYIAFFIALVSFLLDPEWVEPRFGLPVGALFASVGNKYIIDSILPESSDFTLVDILHNLTFAFIFLTIAVSAIALVMEKKGKVAESFRLNKRAGITIVTLYFAINIYLVVSAVWF